MAAKSNLTQQQLIAKAEKQQRRNRVLSVCAAVLFLLLTAVFVWLSFSGRLKGLFVPPAAALAEDEVLVEFIDVGQGDCALIVDGDLVVLVDAGPPGEFAAIATALRKHDINEIDIFIVTHLHNDHIGCAREVLRSFTVKEVFCSPTPEDLMPDTASASGFYSELSKCGAQYRSVLAGESVELEHGWIEFLSPFEDMAYEGLNNYSLVFRYVYGTTAFLFCGDAEREAEEEILYTGYTLACNVIKTAHHGSKYSSTAPFLSQANADWAVISCGAGNSYGYPHQQTLERLQVAGTEALRTDLLGNISFVSNGKTVRLLP